MKLLYIFFTCLFVSDTFCQSQYKGFVMEVETNIPIPFVNIGILNEKLGTVSDDDGYYELGIFNENDNVMFSSIGYKSREVRGDILLHMDAVFLEKDIYEIDQIEIEASRFDKDVILGVRNETRGMSVGFGNPQLGTEIGALIYIDKPTYIKSANFVLNHAKGDSLLFRVNIYSYENDEIGDKVIKENIFIIDKQRKGLFTIDLTPYELILDKSVLLSLEWLRDFDELGNKGVTFDTKKSKKLKGVQMKFSSNSSFRKMPVKPRLKPCFYFVGKQ